MWNRLLIIVISKHVYQSIQCILKYTSPNRGKLLIDHGGYILQQISVKSQSCTGCQSVLRLAEESRSSLVLLTYDADDVLNSSTWVSHKQRHIGRQSSTCQCWAPSCADNTLYWTFTHIFCITNIWIQYSFADGLLRYVIAFLFFSFLFLLFFLCANM